MKKSKWFNKQYILLSVSILLGLIVLIVGSSYAYYIVNLNGDNSNNEVAVKTSNINLEISNVSGSLSLCKTYPISDTEGLSCTPYQFTLTNNNKIDLEYYLNLEYQTSAPEDTIKVAFATCNDENCTNPNYAIAKLSEILDNNDTISSKYSGKLLTAGKTFGTGESNKKTYSIILWIDKDSTYEDDIFNASITAITYTNAQNILSYTVAFDLEDDDTWTTETCKDGYVINGTKCEKTINVKDTYGTLPEIIYENEVAKWYSDKSFTNTVTANTGYLLKKSPVNYINFKPTCSLAINSNSVVASTKNKLNLIYQGWNENYTGDNETSKEIVLASDTAINTYNYYIKDQKNHTNSCSITITKSSSKEVKKQEQHIANRHGNKWTCDDAPSHGCSLSGNQCIKTWYETEFYCENGYTLDSSNTYCYKY